MFDTEIKLCPLSGRKCLTAKCTFWKQTAYDHYNHTGDIGSCKFELAVDSIYEKFGHDREGRFKYNDHDYNTPEPDVPF